VSALSAANSLDLLLLLWWRLGSPAIEILVKGNSVGSDDDAAAAAAAAAASGSRGLLASRDIVRPTKVR